MKQIPYHTHVARQRRKAPVTREPFYFRKYKTKEGAIVEVGINESCQDIKVICTRRISAKEQTVLHFQLGQSGAAAIAHGLMECLAKAEQEGKLKQ